MDSMTRWVKKVEDINVELIQSLEVQRNNKIDDTINFVDKIEAYKKKAQNIENRQDWRAIASNWAKCAELLNPYSDEIKVEHEDPDATMHHFPQIAPDSWESLSKGQKAARAFRYAGYYYDEDGEERRSSYAWYRASALCYSKEQRYDESARSHYLASISYIERFGLGSNFAH